MFVDDGDGFGSIHFRRDVEKAANPINLVKATIKQTQRTVTKAKPAFKRVGGSILNPIVALRKTSSVLRPLQKTILNPLVPLKQTAKVLQKTGKEFKRAAPLLKQSAKILLNPIEAAKMGLNPKKQMANIMGAAQRQPKSGGESSDASQDVYQDANGNVITKEQYDALMAQGQDVYQDNNGAVLTKEQYDTLIAQANQSQDVYRDENGKVITKEEYDRLTALYAQEPQLQYQDEYGNTITKEQYDATMAQYTAAQDSTALQLQPAPLQFMTPQPSSAPQPMEATISGGGGGSSMPISEAGENEDYSSPIQPIDTSSDVDTYTDEFGNPITKEEYDRQMNLQPSSSSDPLSDAAYSVLVALREKARNGTLTQSEKDFINFMKESTSSGLSGFGDIDYKIGCYNNHAVI